MMNIDSIIAHYSNSGVEAYTSYHDTSIYWINNDVAKTYLEKYCVRPQDEDRCNLIQESVFHLDKQLPDMIFRKHFEFITLLGGAMFEEKDFSLFKKFLQSIGEHSFMVVQDTFGLRQHDIDNGLKMWFPSDISWDELMSGNYISTVLFESFYNHYYVFGESGEWGIYVANEGYVGDQYLAGGPAPIRIVGFSPKYRTTFREIFKIPEGQYCENIDYIPEKERPDLQRWVPEKYKK